MKRLRVDWMTKHNMPDVLEIEQHSYADPWWEEQFKEELVGRSSGVVIHEVDGPALGYLVYRIENGHYTIMRLAVHEQHRRRGLARSLLSWLDGQLTKHKRSRVVVLVSELATNAQKFLKATGFHCTDIHKALGPQKEDVYRFVRINVGLFSALRAQQEKGVTQ
jgi:ribosomal-protein-alanine N-acetyltransferase